MVDHAREAKAIAAGLEIGAGCAAIADRIYPSNFDRTKRDKLAEELVAFFVPLFSRIDELERHSHPPIDLTPLVRQELARQRRKERP